MLRWIVALTCLAALTGCGSGDGRVEECASGAGTRCERGAVYRVDSCGHREALESYCGCGCDPDGVSCAACTCTCSETSDCCDGCVPVHEGQACDDGDPATTLDTCRAGLCVGRRPFRSPDPALPDQPALPADPAPVHLVSWECPAGWSAVAHPTESDADGQPMFHCEPPPLPRLQDGGYLTPLHEGEQEGERPVCAPGEDGTYPVLGHATCQPLGELCPAGDFAAVPADVPGGRVYALAGATGGDGSQAAPFGSVTEAVAAAASGDVVVIGKGVYPESITVDKHLVLWGACVQETALDDPVFQTGAGIVEVTGDAHVTLRNLRISGGRNGVLVPSAAGEVVLDLQGVWIRGATGWGGLITRGETTFADCLVSSIQMEQADRRRGAGIIAWGDGAHVRLAHTTIEDCHAAGVVVGHEPGHTRLARLEMEDVAVRHMHGLPQDDVWGLGMRATYRGQATATRCLFEGMKTAGIQVFGYDDALGQDTSAQLRDVIVRDVQGMNGAHSKGMGLLVSDGGSVSARQVLVDRAHTAGIYVAWENTTADLQQVLVRDTGPDPATGWYGCGLIVEMGASTSLAGGLLERNHSIGLALMYPGSQATVCDLVVLGTDSQPVDPADPGRDHWAGHGIQVNQGAALTLERARLTHNREGGLVIYGPDTVVDAVDLRVLDTRTRSTEASTAPDQAGFGLGVYYDPDAMPAGSLAPRVALRRALFDRNHMVGIAVQWPGAEAIMEDITVKNTMPQGADLQFGRGLEVDNGAHAVLSRGLFEGNHDDAIVATVTAPGLPPPVLELEDITIRDAGGQPGETTYGRGMILAESVDTTLDRCRIERARHAGILVAGSGVELDVHDLTVVETQPLLWDPRVPGLDDMFGRGFVVQDGAAATVIRGRLVENHDTALFVTGPTSGATFSDIRVEDTRSQASDLLGGIGMQVAGGAEVVLTDALFVRSHESGVVATGDGTSLMLARVGIHETLPRECSLADETLRCPTQGTSLGIGLCSHYRASVVFEDVEIVDAALAGLELAGGERADGLWIPAGSLEGRNLIIRNNPIGVILLELPDAYDFESRVRDLWMEDNQTNFNSLELAVPDALPGLSSDVASVGLE